MRSLLGMSRLASSLPIVLLVACSGDSNGAPADTSDALDAPDGSDAADVADTIDAPDVEPAVPILERAISGDYACSEALAPLGGTGPSWFPLALSAVGDRLWLLRIEDGIKLSTLGTDGALGPDIDLGGPQWSVPGGAIGERDGVMTLVWSEPLDAGGQHLRVALVATSGEVLAAAATLPGTFGQEASSPRTLPTVAGHRLVWIAGDGSRQQIRHALLEDGAFAGEPTTLVALESPYGGSLLGLVADDDGFALAWTASNASFASEVWFRTFANDGAPRHPARRVSREGQDGTNSGTFWRSSSSGALARVGERYFVTFTEDYQRPGSDFSELGHAVLQVAVVDARGDGARVPLTSPIEGRTATAASFYRLGDALGLYWAEGTIIRICGGCYVDYVLRTILLDPATLDPLSAPATHTAQDHGFNAPHVAVLGGEVVSVSLQDFHALSRPASAVMECVASE